VCPESFRNYKVIIETMKLYTSGTTGKPKEIIYTDEDLLKVRRSLQKFYDIWKITGTVYNLFTAGSNLSFIAANDYGKVSGGRMVTSKNTNTGNVFGPCPAETSDEIMQRFVKLSKTDKPNVVIGLPWVVLDFLRQADTSSMKLAICNKGITDEAVAEIKKLCPGIEVASAYGFTEAKAAWTTCKDEKQGYHIFKESGTFMKEGDELIYNGHHTGDSGEILDGACPTCGLGIQRVKNVKRIKK